MEPMVDVKNLGKWYGGLPALAGLNLTVQPGDIYGFIGPNGAGKTTTFKILATVLRPDAGTVRIAGLDIGEGDAVRSMIGYMPDAFGVYEDMTVYQYLDFFAAAYLIPSGRRRALIADILKLTDLEFKKDAMVQSLSRGMQQRLGVARVLIHDPRLLILDEPASGLDPRARVELRELLKELAAMGKTVLISSHILSELAEVCNRVGIVERGKLIFEGSRAGLVRLLAGQTTLVIEPVPEDADRALEVLRAAPFTASIEKANGVLRLKLKENAAEVQAIPAFLVQQGCRFVRFGPEDISLEQAFMTLTEGKLA